MSGLITASVFHYLPSDRRSLSSYSRAIIANQIATRKAAMAIWTYVLVRANTVRSIKAVMKAMMMHSTPTKIASLDIPKYNAAGIIPIRLPPPETPFAVVPRRRLL